jgi:hypothetical protein
LPGRPFEEIAAEAEGENPFEEADEAPDADEGDHFRRRPFPLDHPVFGGIDDFADPFAEAPQAAARKFGRGLGKYAQLRRRHASTIRLFAVGGYAEREPWPFRFPVRS